jgi:hypothetical protein
MRQYDFSSRSSRYTQPAMAAQILNGFCRTLRTLIKRHREVIRGRHVKLVHPGLLSGVCFERRSGLLQKATPTLFA